MIKHLEMMRSFLNGLKFFLHAVFAIANLISAKLHKLLLEHDILPAEMRGSIDDKKFLQIFLNKVY